MKLSKKLIPAIGMLMLSAVMLVTSSFAWFSMNEKVTATGMSVSAKGDQVYLQIVAGTDADLFDDDSADQYTAAAGTSSAEILPTNVAASHDDTNKTMTVYKGGAPVWVSSTGNSYSDGTSTGKYSNVSAITGYYLQNTFLIRLNDSLGIAEANAPLKVSEVKFTGTAPSANLAKSVSVLVTCTIGGQTKGMLFKQNDSYEFAHVTSAVETEESSDATLTTGNFADTVGAQINVYVFFDGSNPACTLANLAQVTTQGFTVEVSFTCA